MPFMTFEAEIGENRILSLLLPCYVHPGKASVTVVFEEGDAAKADESPKPGATETFELFMRFGDGRRLDGITIKELVAEGRR